MINKWIGIGRLGADVEIRYSQNGLTIANFTIACDESYKDKSGEWVNKTEWIRVVCFNQLGERAGTQLSKGKLVYVEGKLQTRSYDDKDGIKRYVTEINAQTFRLLEKKQQDTSSDDRRSYYGGGGDEKNMADSVPF